MGTSAWTFGGIRSDTNTDGVTARPAKAKESHAIREEWQVGKNKHTLGMTSNTVANVATPAKVASHMDCGVLEVLFGVRRATLSPTEPASTAIVTEHCRGLEFGFGFALWLFQLFQLIVRDLISILRRDEKSRYKELCDMKCSTCLFVCGQKGRIGGGPRALF